MFTIGTYTPALTPRPPEDRGGLFFGNRLGANAQWDYIGKRTFFSERDFRFKSERAHHMGPWRKLPGNRMGSRNYSLHPVLNSVGRRMPGRITLQKPVTLVRIQLPRPSGDRLVVQVTGAERHAILRPIVVALFEISCGECQWDYIRQSKGTAPALSCIPRSLVATLKAHEGWFPVTDGFGLSN